MGMYMRCATVCMSENECEGEDVGVVVNRFDGGGWQRCFFFGLFGSIYRFLWRESWCHCSDRDGKRRRREEEGLIKVNSDVRSPPPLAIYLHEWLCLVLVEGHGLFGGEDSEEGGSILVE